MRFLIKNDKKVDSLTTAQAPDDTLRIRFLRQVVSLCVASQCFETHRLC